MERLLTLNIGIASFKMSVSPLDSFGSPFTLLEFLHVDHSTLSVQYSTFISLPTMVEQPHVSRWNRHEGHWLT